MMPLPHYCQLPVDSALYCPKTHKHWPSRICWGSALVDRHPSPGDGLQAAMVYLALSQPNSNNRLVREVQYKPVAPLLMVDLIAHKGYDQRRQYRLGNLDEQYRQQMEKLTKDTNTLLHNLARVSVSAEQLDALANKYGLLVSVVVDLNWLHSSLKRQKFNFNLWRKQAGGGDIIEFHHRHLKDATKELELLGARRAAPAGSGKHGGRHDTGSAG